MKNLGSMLCGLFLILGVAIPVNANVFFFDGFENPWTGDYAPGWVNAAYRHGDPPVGKMMQQITTSYSGNYGLQLIADSVPQSWMWWTAVAVEKLPHYALKKDHDPYVSVWYYDELWDESTLNKSGQVFAVPDWVNPYIPPGEDWTDVQFGSVEYMLDNYYYVAVGEGHPGWQDTDEVRTLGWHNLEFRLSSADGHIYFYVDGTEVGQSYRNDYTNLGTEIGLYTRFTTPLSDWANKPYTLWDDFEVGSNARPQATFYFGDFELSEWQTQNLPQIWDLTQCDLTLTYTIDLSGQLNSGWTPVQVGLREVGCGNIDPDHGGWMQSIWQNPDGGTNPVEADLDDHFVLVDHGWDSDEKDYDVDDNWRVVSPPFGSYDSYAFWFDRDGVDEYQATYWNYKDGKTYNTNGMYDVVIEYRNDEAATLSTMMATINGESQGFYLDGYSSTAPPSEQPVGKSFTADDMSQMQVFLGRGGGEGSVVVSDLTVTGCLVMENGMATGGGWFTAEDTGGIGNVTPGGKASFGFVAKRKNDMSSGQVVFQYKTDDLNLKSTSYDWVTLATTQVMFEGIGTLNGNEGYKFRVRAIDGDKINNGTDRFEIRIWTPQDDYLSPTHRAEGNLMGGQIVVHKK